MIRYPMFLIPLIIHPLKLSRKQWTMVESDVAMDVITPVVQPNTPIATSLNSTRKEPEPVSVPEREKSLREETADASEGERTVSGNQNSESKGEKDNSTSTREDDKIVPDKEKGDESSSDEEVSADKSEHEKN